MIICLIRSVILYVLLITTVRLLGKRQLGEMEPSEFVVALLIADLASVPMQDLGIPLLTGIIPILTILSLEILLSSLSYYSISFRKLLCGRPVILMENGKLLQKNLMKTRITPDELTEHLREKDILDLSTVKYAILETNGQISAILKETEQPVTRSEMGITGETFDLPFTIISGGTLMRDNLELSGLGDKWLDGLLKKHHCTQKQVYLLTVNQTGQIYLALKSEDL